MRSLPLVLLLATAAISSVIDHDPNKEHSDVFLLTTDNEIVSMIDMTALTETTYFPYLPDISDLPIQTLERKLQIANNVLNVGKVNVGDTLLANVFYVKKPCKDKIHVQDIVMTGNSSVKITAIRVEEIGTPQNAVATIKDGGIGKSFVVIRLKSAKGAGYNFETKIWGVKQFKRFYKRFATLLYKSPS